MRVGIIGAGSAGAMAAWRCARAGHEVLLFEQFALDHDWGSSFGDSRIVRRVYPDPFYTALMGRAYELWDELQTDVPKEELFIRAGGVFAGPSDHPEILAAGEALSASGVAYSLLTPEACAEQFPAFRLQPGETALYEPSMGYARASNAVRVAVRLARQNGAALMEQRQVISLQAPKKGTGVRAKLRDGSMEFLDRAIIAAGPWSASLLAPLGVQIPLTITRQAYIHLAIPDGSLDFEPGRFPVWIDAETYLYGFPCLGNTPGIKIASHRHGDVIDPRSADRTVREGDIAPLTRYASSRIPSVGSEVVYRKICLYSNTPDEDFVIDAVPALPDALILSACSGHGFKFGPLLGQIAAEFVASGRVPPELARFRLDRFCGANATSLVQPNEFDG